MTNLSETTKMLAALLHGPICHSFVQQVFNPWWYLRRRQPLVTEQTSPSQAVDYSNVLEDIERVNPQNVRIPVGQDLFYLPLIVVIWIKSSNLIQR